MSDTNELVDARSYATRLLVSLMEKHYPDRHPDWSPLPDLMGVLTQIDNLSTGLVRAPVEAVPVVDRYYIDCEFDGHNGPLLSIALVREDGDGIHIRADVEPMDLWVRQNVMPVMDDHRAPKSICVYHDEVGGAIRSFIGEGTTPVIIADSPVDIGRFCQALSTGPNGQWASSNCPRMTFEVHNIDCYPTDLEGAVQHNAWWDAMALRHALLAHPPAQAGAVTEAQGWRPIETAPKDGTEIIARRSARFMAFSCWWQDGEWLHYDHEDGLISYRPQEWMPFPPAVAAAPTPPVNQSEGADR